jgi:hypothetical protein
MSFHHVFHASFFNFGDKLRHTNFKLNILYVHLVSTFEHSILLSCKRNPQQTKMDISSIITIVTSPRCKHLLSFMTLLVTLHKNSHDHVLELMVVNISHNNIVIVDITHTRFGFCLPFCSASEICPKNTCVFSKYCARLKS